MARITSPVPLYDGLLELASPVEREAILKGGPREHLENEAIFLGERHEDATAAYSAMRAILSRLIDDLTDEPVPLPAIRAGGQPLRYLDFLIYREVQAVVLFGGGVLVNVPAPERFALHKLLVSRLRVTTPQSRIHAAEIPAPLPRSGFVHGRVPALQISARAGRKRLGRFGTLVRDGRRFLGAPPSHLRLNGGPSGKHQVPLENEEHSDVDHEPTQTAARL